MKLRKYALWLLLAGLALAGILVWNAVRPRERTLVYTDLPVSAVVLEDFPNVTVALESVCMAERCVTLSFTNTGSQSYPHYGLGDLEVAADDGTWRRIPFVWGDYSRIVLVRRYTLPAGETVSMTLDWGYYYGCLPAGHYRAYTALEDAAGYHYIGTEFDILSP